MKRKKELEVIDTADEVIRELDSIIESNAVAKKLAEDRLRLIQIRLRNLERSLNR